MLSVTSLNTTKLSDWSPNLFSDIANLLSGLSSARLMHHTRRMMAGPETDPFDLNPSGDYTLSRRSWSVAAPLPAVADPPGLAAFANSAVIVDVLPPGCG